jgi:hypothetical protein
VKFHVIMLAAAAVMAAAPRVDAAQGIQLTQKLTNGTNTQTLQIELDNSHMRTELVNPATGTKQIVIFDGAKQVLYIINSERKTYTEMTRADVDRMATQLQSMRGMMANMPPAQRAQMEARMGGAGAPVKPEYKRAGTDHVGRWTCDKYEGYVKGTKTTELCTVPPTSLGFAMADLDVTRQMADFYSKMAPQGADQVSSVGRLEDQGFSGFPVKRVITTGQSQITMEVVDASRTNLPDDAFTIPAGFTKQTMPMMGGR